MSVDIVSGYYFREVLMYLGLKGKFACPIRLQCERIREEMGRNLPQFVSLIPMTSQAQS